MIYKKSFILTDFEFHSDGRILNIKENKGDLKMIKQIYFSSVNICLQWWEMIKHLIISQVKKKLSFDNEIIPADMSLNNNSVINFNTKKNESYSESVLLNLNTYNNIRNAPAVTSIPAKSHSCFDITSSEKIEFKLERFEHSFVINNKFKLDDDKFNSPNSSKSSSDLSINFINSAPQSIKGKISTHNDYKETIYEDENLLKNKINVLNKKNMQVYFLLNSDSHNMIKKRGKLFIYI